MLSIYNIKFSQTLINPKIYVKDTRIHLHLSKKGPLIHLFKFNSALCIFQFNKALKTNYWIRLE